MNFYQRETFYAILRRLPNSALKHQSAMRFYEEYISRNLSDMDEFERGHLSSEARWISAECPYYKIMPEWINKLRTATLDVPGKYLESPFPAFVILLPKDNGIILQPSVARELRSILVATAERGDYEAALIKGPLPNRVVFADFDSGQTVTRLGISLPLTFYFTTHVNEERSLEDSFRIVQNSEYLDQTGASFKDDIDFHVLKDVFRIIMATTLIATGAADRVLEYDVISSDLEKYEQGDYETRKKLEDKARRRGKHGWILGGNGSRRLPRSLQNDHEYCCSGKTLKYSHIRGGHFHLYWIGPGGSTPKVRWVDPTTVRPDLPKRVLTFSTARSAG